MTAETQRAVRKQVHLHCNEHIAGSGSVGAQVWGECIDGLRRGFCSGRLGLRFSDSPLGVCTDHAAWQKTQKYYLAFSLYLPLFNL